MTKLLPHQNSIFDNWTRISFWAKASFPLLFQLPSPSPVKLLNCDQIAPNFPAHSCNKSFSRQHDWGCLTRHSESYVSHWVTPEDTLCNLILSENLVNMLTILMTMTSMKTRLTIMSWWLWWVEIRELVCISNPWEVVKSYSNQIGSISVHWLRGLDNNEFITKLFRLLRVLVTSTGKPTI